MKKFYIVTLFVVFLSACNGVPKDKEIESIVRSDILSDGFDDLFAVENFAKNNGFRESDNVYIVDVEYDLVFLKSFIDVVREISNDPTGPQYGLLGSKFILASIQSNFGQFEVGDRIHKTDKITLHKTEKGWQVSQTQG